jgi:hypothetical protein
LANDVHDGMSVALEFRILHFETLNPLQDLDRGMCLARFSKEVVEILGATRTGQTNLTASNVGIAAAALGAVE